MVILLQVSVRWRESLNVDHIWYKLCRRLGHCQLFGKVRIVGLMTMTNVLL